MSIRIIQLVWNSAKPTDPGQRFTLVALADNADNNGHCYPGVKELARKTGMGRRTISRHIAELRVAGFLMVVPKGHHWKDTIYTNAYTLNLEKLHTANMASQANMALSDDAISDSPRCHLEQGVAPNRQHAIRKETVMEPSVNLSSSANPSIDQTEQKKPKMRRCSIYSEQCQDPTEPLRESCKAPSRPVMGGSPVTANDPDPSPSSEASLFDPRDFDEPIGDCPADEVCRVIDYHWNVVKKPYWRDIPMERAFFLRKFPTMRTQTPAHYRKPGNGSAGGPSIFHEDLAARFGPQSREQLFFLAATEEVEKDPNYLRFCKSHDEDHRHIECEGPNPQVFTPHLKVKSDACKPCAARKLEMIDVITAEYEEGKR